MSNGREEGSKSVRGALAGATQTIQLHGELVHRNADSVAVRRGRAVFEVEADQVVEVREKEGGQVEVIFRANAPLLRTTLVRGRTSARSGASRVIRDPFECGIDDCSVLECNECSDCVGDCSVCVDDCTECSDCVYDCTECSVCVGDCSVCIDDCSECSIFSRSGRGRFGNRSGSAWVRRSSRRGPRFK
jgi:hypothetical protein